MIAMTKQLDQVFAALSDPTRRKILLLLLEDDMTVTDVAEPFGMSLAAISKHLVVLSRAGLIQRERRGRITWCKLDTESLRVVSLWIGSFGLVDPIDLDGLERFLAAEGLQHEAHDGDDDHDEPDEVDDPVHENSP
jgi:DNA-binding transcriptional ArsR family regulator